MLPDDLAALYGEEGLGQRLLSRVVYDLRRPDLELGPCWIWTGAVTSRGYGCLTLQRRSGPRRLSVHRLALALWSDFDLDGSLQALHRCDQKACINPQHLYAGTPSDNMADAYVSGLLKLPERHASLLSEAEVIDILRLLLDGCTMAEVARRYGVSHETIRAIRHGRSWKRVLQRQPA
ncbi:hypothetical protein NET02_11545 [Thermomicrobiaceae bacterium CFH 74404]|uniref:HNH nuclease domain-containing protein n=1 Tax=Thermalbibacter longus TaxID=2951981 RepID=A0AA41WFS9_9BACT|nr:hypothetical protein [Thermalbibacter longus]MCM8749784.1 hypothetical protein [Thermalbibacter longus]